MAWALSTGGNISVLLGSHQDGRRRLEEGLAIWRASGNQSSVSSCLGFLARLARTEGRLEESAILARQAYAVSLEQSLRSRGGLNRLFYGRALEHLGEFSETQAAIQEGLALVRDLGHRVMYTQMHTALAGIEMHRGRCEEARDHGETGLALDRACGDRSNAGHNLLLIGCVDLMAGAFASALQHVQGSIAVYEEFRQTEELSVGFAVLALAAHGLGKAREAKQRCHEK